MPQENSPTVTFNVEFGGIVPILRVTNLEASLTYYVDSLGFKIDWKDADGYAQVSRGKAAFMLCADDQGQPGTWAYVGISDADALYNEFRNKGVPVRHPPTNYPWGARELQVEDPDGHVLRFGSDATDEPIGSWLDGQGRLWRPQPNGSWHVA